MFAGNLKSRMNNKHSGRIYIFIILAILGLIVYSKAVFAPFVFDDDFYIINNPWIRSLRNFTDLSAMRYAGDLSFALNYKISGLKPVGFHLTNIVIHILNSFLVYLLINAIFETPFMENAFKGEGATGIQAGIAFISSIIFLVHPVQTQAVTYVTQRYASLAAFFYLSALVLYLNSRLVADAKPSRGHGALYAFSLVSTVLAMKTKEISFTIPFVIALFELTLFSHGKQRRWRLLIPFAATLLIIPESLMAQQIHPGGHYNEAGRYMSLRKIEELSAMSKYAYLITSSTVIMTYLRLIFWPANQHFDYFYPPAKSLFEPRVFLSSLALASIIVISVCILIRSIKSGKGYSFLISLGAIWFFITLSIESSVIPIRDVISEHRVYLPSIGVILSSVSAAFCIKEAVQRKRGLKFKTFTVAVSVILALPLGAAAYMRNAVWSDKFALYSDEVAKNPYVVSPRINLGTAYFEEGMLKEAAAQFKKAVEIKPAHLIAHNDLAEVYRLLGFDDEAISEFKTITALSPTNAKAHYNLGVLYLKKKLIKEAEAEFTEVVRLNPKNSEARRVLEYLRQGRADKIVIR